MSNPIIKMHSWFVACLFLFCQSVLANPQVSIQTTENIRWDSSLTLPDIDGKPHSGLAGAFCGCIGDFLFIAGGANFPMLLLGMEVRKHGGIRSTIRISTMPHLLGKK